MKGRSIAMKPGTLLTLLLFLWVESSCGGRRNNLVNDLVIEQDDKINATQLDCEMKMLALQYGRKLQSWRPNDDVLWTQIHDALRLTKDCHIPRPMSVHPLQEAASVQQQVLEDNIGNATLASRRRRLGSKNKKSPSFCHLEKCIFVSTNACAGDGSIQHPFGSAHLALARSRSMSKPVTIVFRGGIHTLEETLKLDHQDSGLSLRGFPGESAWLSGAIPIHNATWDVRASPRKNVQSTLVINLSQLLRNRSLPKVFSLFGLNQRWIRARYPNSNPETDQWGYASPNKYQHAIPTGQAVLEWERPPKGAIPNFTYIDFSTPHANLPIKNDSTMVGYNLYASGSGGVCADLWGPQADSYWCSNASAGGWAEVDKECAVTGQMQIPSAMQYNTSHAVGQRMQSYEFGLGDSYVFAWHSQSWAMHMFAIQSHNPRRGRLVFRPQSGKQGGRNWCRCDQCTYAGGWCGQHQDPPDNSDQRLIGGDWLLEHVLDELDTPGEFYYDRRSGDLSLIPNSTDKTNPLKDLRFGMLETLVSVQGANNISISHLGFRDTTPTFMGTWSAPSGGDWSLHRGGAIFIENSTNVNIIHGTFRRLDGNAVFLSRKTRGVTISKSIFEWLGENAIATWGDSDHYDAATREDFPMDTLIEDNVMRELGIYQKQSSGVGQAKAAKTTIRNNIMFNLPRAAINFNDALGGGDAVVRNLLFNTCRESGDHGPINSWDRQPFLTTLRYGKPSFSPLMRTIAKNFIISNYGAAQGVDNDDGSSWYHVHHNVWHDSDGVKMDYGGHDSIFEENLIVGYPHHLGCIGFGSFYAGHGHTVRHNKCIIPKGNRAAISLEHCNRTNAILHDNEYYSPEGQISVHCFDTGKDYTLEFAQDHFGMESGTTSLLSPSIKEIIIYSKAVLF